MRVALFLCLICSCLNLFAQDDKDDLLNTNANPVFNLMGIAPTDFRRPTSLKDVTATIQTATNDLNMLPVSYAVEIAPDEVFQFDLPKWMKDDLGISVGFNREFIDPESGNEILLVGSGMTFGIRQNLTGVKSTKSKKLDKQLDAIALNTANNSFGIASAPLTGMALDNAIKQEKDRLTDKFNTEYAPKGWFADFSCGYVHEFRSDGFQDGQSHNMGLWVTGGNENLGDWFSILTQAKLTNSPHISRAMGNVSSAAFDFGFRFILNAAEQKFDLSFEWVKRIRSGLPEDMNNTRFLFNLNATVGENTKLNLTLGRDFEETIIREGNLLSLVNLVKGF